MIYIPVVLSLLAVAVLGIGLPRARRFRRPPLFTLGLILVAAGLMAAWILPLLVAAVLPNGQSRWIVQLLAFLAAVSVFGGGLNLMSRADVPADEE